MKFTIWSSEESTLGGAGGGAAAPLPAQGRAHVGGHTALPGNDAGTGLVIQGLVYNGKAPV